MRVPFILYVDMECRLKQLAHIVIILMNYQQLINGHTLSGYSLLTYCSFDNTKNMTIQKMLCKDLKEHAKRIIYREKRSDIFNRRGK